MTSSGEHRLALEQRDTEPCGPPEDAEWSADTWREIEAAFPHAKEDLPPGPSVMVDLSLTTDILDSGDDGN